MDALNQSLYSLSIAVEGIKYCEDAAFFILSIVTEENGAYKVERRFSEIEALHLELCARIPCMPYLPPKSLSKLSNQAIEKRKCDLDLYFKAMANRSDIKRTKEFRVFLSIGVKISPLLESRGAISSLPSNVISLDFDTQSLVLFVLCTDESLATKLSSIWSIVSNSSAGNKSHLLVYQLTRDPDHHFSFVKLWGYPSVKGGRHVRWSKGLTLALIGYEDGSVVCLRVKTEEKFTKFEEFCIIRRHTGPITGLETYEPTAILFSISKDKTLVLTDLTQSNKFALNEKSFDSEPRVMAMDSPGGRLFIALANGVLVIMKARVPYDYSNVLKPPNPLSITCMDFNSKQNFVLTGSSTGIVSVYSVGESGKEKLAVLLSQIEVSNLIKTVSFSPSLKMVVHSHGKALVFMDSVNASYQYSHSVSGYDVTFSLYYEQFGMAITAGKDSCIKFWEIASEIYKAKDSLINQYILEEDRPKATYTLDELDEEDKEELTESLFNASDYQGNSPMKKEILGGNLNEKNSKAKASEPKVEEIKKEVEFSDDDDNLAGWNN